MNGEMFAQQVETMRKRLQKLYQDASQLPLSQSDLVPRAFMELGTASEELQVALEELRQQNQELLATQEKLVAQRQHSQDLFNLASNAYIQTDIRGSILQVNCAAAVLFNVKQELLIGQQLNDFVNIDRPLFRNQLNRICHENLVQGWEIPLLPHKSNPISVKVTVAVVPDSSAKAVVLNWLIHDKKNQRVLQTALKPDECDPIQVRPTQVYSKGEIISLQPETIWLVVEGLVKLSTLVENGAEVLVGLAGKDTIFGSGLTDLQIYQAIAFSQKVQLVSISFKEIETSKHLAMNLLPKINQRLRQAESLLAISGQRQVIERLYRLLLLLKQEIGQPVTGGTLLSVRLTHEDLANACSTTRVTITRILKKLKQQGKITFDATHHIILIEK